MKRSLCIFICLFAFGLQPINSAFSQDRTTTKRSRNANETEVMIAAIRTVVSLIQDVTQRHAAAPISDQLQRLNGRLNSAAHGFGGFRRMDGPVDEDRLVELLQDIRRELRAIYRELDRNDQDRLARRLDDVVENLDDAVDRARLMTRRFTTSDDNRDRSRSRIRISGRDDRDDDENDNNRNWWDDYGRTWRQWGVDWQRQSSAFVGDFTQRWPFGDDGLYRSIPSLRYNRVEGFVVGIRRMPLDWSDYDRGRIYGQFGYAFAMDEIRYEVGAETRLNRPYRNNDLDLKIGGAYRKNTTTRDQWKASWAENTLAASLFRTDFFDYFETEGWTAYLSGRMTPYVQISAGYRQDEYFSLEKATSWSLFGGDPFRSNPAIDEGQMRSFVFALEGGRVRHLRYNPSGFAFRAEAELGTGLGGDFSFNRYIGDIRVYTRMNRDAGLSLRLRGGYADGTVPLQKAFTLGGVGSMRAYPQNIFLGTRMLLANVEYSLYNPGFFDDILDDMTFFGLFDAGWTNSGGSNEFDFDDVIPVAGFGIAVDDRNIRLELAWPLRDMGTGTEPTLWLRLNPTF